MFTRLLRRIVSSGRIALQALERCLVAVTRPAAPTLLAGTLADLTRSTPQVVVENALLRQQLLVLRRSVKRPRCTPADRAIFVLLAGRVSAWWQAMLIVQPDTLLRWHRERFRWHWRRKSRARSTARRAKVSDETIALIRGSVRRECLDHALVLGEAHLRRVRREYGAYFNTMRPHQSLQQRIPDPAATCALRPEEGGPVRTVPVLGGLHHMYLRAA